jgi:IS30 family transposase
MGVHKSTISREIRRNRGQRGYRASQAHRFSRARHHRPGVRIQTEAWQKVERYLREDWSPEQISGYLREQEGIRISHEWIYRYVYQDKKAGGDLHRHLRCQKVYRKRYGSGKGRRGQIQGRVGIEQRPEVVAQRSRLGDWEIDTVIGQAAKAPVLVTAVERKSRFTVIAVAANKTAQAVTQALLSVLYPLSNLVHTLTYDNGKEFAGHELISEALKAEGYFANPYHSWERGLNENTNGLIRQYFPKGMNFNQLAHEQVSAIMNKLNNRPRKCLGFKTPAQVFFDSDIPVALVS